MRRLRLIFVPALALGAALVLSACGGDDSPEQPIVIPTTSTTSALDSEAYIEEADALCEEANSAISEFVESGEGFSASGDIADLRQGVLTELQDLGPPADDQATLDQFFTGLEAQVAAGEKIALANERGSDTAEFETELDAAQAETLTAAEAYGFTVCGQEPGATSSTTSTPDTGVVPSEPAAPVAPAPTAPDTSGGGVGDTGGDTGGGTGGGGVGPGGGVGAP